MKLTSFQIVNCFGFQHSGRINLLDPNNFIYVLGRNSSGKSSLLNAIKYFELGITPSEMPNFQNFNDSGKAPFLIAGFSVEDTDLEFDRFEKALTDILNKLRLDQGALNNHPPLKQMAEKAKNDL